MAKLGIIGFGIVGKAVEYGFRGSGNIITAYDKYKDLATLQTVVTSSEFIFVCLPTPYKNERIDLSIMDENIEQAAKFASGTDKIIIIKSTVVPGVTRAYVKKYPGVKFCFNPEFLTEANFLEDFVKGDRIVIGADDDKVSLRVTDLYRERFPLMPLYRTDLTTAEMVKYMANCYLATKVIFANEIFELCEKLGIKYEEVKSMVVADKRIGNTHLDVTTVKGFGGKCFPKDMVALMGLYRELGLDCSLMEAAWKKNLRIRKIKDWEEIPFVKT
ncbi:MAG: hypothetical protein A2268_14285 [Candidatus Raymondbacteria bacterium RifOxyA12_full_50_37]|uniref:UDP-glucose/GDP-mannose dehydrogenase C-terminal domain-containing protein n=1 Tax=Candidatus Raymondbacteria bacterium RIFOXYD12_FULL_49_13 TaxID=1817890 RepID=A0A1F7FKZ3_UNCRA|nr:MAG: hypothetical protein A2268_14285 [Candidatus Raymondbacteria bacterium RifOxyA12_full_50_37]OGJ86927.1 MAG: hypothetical protein A2350_02200 [Candidatus Raymondbacteria bacterium RifOxyB12_full_50_8]OGJ88248.1 MAG: hypothetical protein A2248_19625 [Candidatus Raymondbacteria bacterium RIFOXYA2_FULL_49_16]OGK05750.1 MAG: hypothetical protein A2487_19595 [Candidatus Raymondbacteria bacterium RifOxyC12_full_50_8]OGK07293.1 MAG: hypothetical protein A2519_14295 [Candidatus Raymondbacteria b